MEKFGELISILLQHSQRFIDFWNLQIIISLAVLGFAFTHTEAISRLRVRVGITVLFLFIAVFTVSSLSTHQQREEGLYAALQSHVAAAPADFTQADVAYLDSLKPTPFPIKAGALLFADALVLAAVWMGPKMKG